MAKTGAGAARPARLLLGVGLGLLTLAVGVALARLSLPEWEARLDAPQGHFVTRFTEVAERSGFRLAEGRPRVSLVLRGSEAYEPYRQLGDQGGDWLRATKSAVRVEVCHRVLGTGGFQHATMVADFSLDGTVQSLGLVPPGALGPWLGRRAPRALVRRLAEAALGSGETLAPNPLVLPSGPLDRTAYTIAGAQRPHHLVIVSMAAVNLLRGPGAATAPALRMQDRLTSWIFLHIVLGGVGLLAATVLFAALVIRRRVSIVNALLLSALTFVSLRPFGPSSGFHWVVGAFIAWLTAVWIFFLWSSGESLLRTSGKDATTSLDALAKGRLGPRSGRSLLAGFACGAALGGAKLAVLAGLEALPGVWLAAPSLRLPVFSELGSPLAKGIAVAATVALCLGLALRLVALRWAGFAAALAAALLTSPLAVSPWAVGTAVKVAFAWALVAVCRRFGLNALLVCAVTSFLLPAAVFTGLQLPWATASFAVAAALALAIPIAGLAGLTRSAAAELARMEPPAFVRRLLDDKRLLHEMGLLARMQQGLLPRRLPELPGWEIAARSVIANEAGGDLYDMITDPRGQLWVAAGDVAGHGYSCAVAQAMTKAALASLIGRHGSPAEILVRADRVLRTAGPTRHFTTLALLRLDPQTGECLFANAGHPPAYLVGDDGVRELAVAGLPLGMGPARSYEEASLTLAPGTALVFCSDGLFEAQDADAAVYGFPRLAAILPALSWRTADRILAAVFDDWRSHLRTLLPRDDTTIVVLKRKAGIG